MLVTVALVLIFFVVRPRLVERWVLYRWNGNAYSKEYTFADDASCSQTASRYNVQVQDAMRWQNIMRAAGQSPGPTPASGDPYTCRHDVTIVWGW